MKYGGWILSKPPFFMSGSNRFWSAQHGHGCCSGLLQQFVIQDAQAEHSVLLLPDIWDQAYNTSMVLRLRLTFYLDIPYVR